MSGTSHHIQKSQVMREDWKQADACTAIHQKGRQESSISGATYGPSCCIRWPRCRVCCFKKQNTSNSPWACVLIKSLPQVSATGQDRVGQWIPHPMFCWNFHALSPLALLARADGNYSEGSYRELHTPHTRNRLWKTICMSFVLLDVGSSRNGKG